MDTKTLESLLTEVLQKVLGSVIPSIGPMLGAVVSKGIQGLTGNDAMWSSVVYSNQTTSWIYATQQRQRIARMSEQVQDDYRTESRRQVFENYARSLTSKDDYKGGDYEKFIADQVAGWQANKFKTGIYDRAAEFFGLDDTAASMANMGMVASNMARHGLMYDDRNYMTGSKFLASNLFTGDVYDAKNKTFNMQKYDKRAWGSFGKEAVSGLAAAITKDTDLLQGYDSRSADDLKAATNRFREMVRGYAEALEPLKDVFGEDMRNMIGAIEGMTGQNLASLSPMQVKALSTRIADRTNAGLYGINDVANMTGVMNAALSSMSGLGTYNYLSGTSQAMDVLDMTRNNNYSTSYRTREQFRQFARSWTLNTANSGAADMFAKGYGLWRQRAMEKGRNAKEITFDTFQSEVMARADEKGIDRRRAMLDMLGVRSVSDLDAGMGNAGYADAIRSGAAGRMARGGAMQQQLKRGRFSMGLDRGFIQAMGLNTNAEGSVKAREAYDDIMALVTENPDFANYDEDTLKRTLLENPAYKYLVDNDEEYKEWLKKNPNAKDEEKAAARSTYANKIANRLSSGLNYLKAKRPELVDKAVAEGNINRADKIDKAAKSRRDRMDKINAEVFSGKGIQDIFQGGFSIDRLKKKLTASGVINAAGQDPDDMLAILEAGGMAGEAAFKGNAEEAAGLASNILNYANSAAGMSNSGFTSALDAFKKNRDKMAGMEDKNSVEYKKLQAEQQVNAAKMSMYTRLDESEANAFWSGDIYKDGKKLEGDAALAEKTRLANEWQAKSYSTDPKKRRSMAESLTQHNINQKLSQSSDKVRQLYEQFKKEYTDKDDVHLDNRRITEFYENNKNKLGAKDAGALEELKKLVDSSISKSSNATGGQQDMMGLLKDVLELLKKYFGDQNKQQTKKQTSTGGSKIKSLTMWGNAPEGANGH